MTERIAHRGPDADGFALFDDQRLALGHRRLSIVDLSPTGAQPMSSASGRFTMVFNGEIYNFRGLRHEQLAAGHQFRGTSDTEVALSLFDAMGVERALPRFAGMFAMAVWDRAEEVLWLARDRMGEKPLYFGEFGGTFAFASELKAIRVLPNAPREVNPAAIADVLARGGVRGTRTILQGVEKLAPGCGVALQRVGGLLQRRAFHYWSVDSAGKHAPAHPVPTETQSIDTLDQLLADVVRDEMLADVPVGAFLSGGIDSSLIVAVMQRVAEAPVRTFTVGFEEAAFDESAYAAEVATFLGTEHTEIRLNANAALGYVDSLAGIFDEPFADSSQLPTLLVCQATRQHVTVALSGDGGDELFGGYPQYMQRDAIASIASQVPDFARTSVAAGLGLIPERLLGSGADGGTWRPNARARLQGMLRTPTSRIAYETLVSEWVDPGMVLSHDLRARLADSAVEASRLSVAWPDAPTTEESRMRYDMQTYLPDDILVKVDRSAMSVSLETRAPFLDHRIVEFAMGLPLPQKIQGHVGKVLLRRLLERYLPARLWERPKRGFAIPLGSWLRGELRPWAEAMLTPDAVLRTWFDAPRVQKIWTAHQAGADHAARLWRILMLIQWLRAESVRA